MSFVNGLILLAAAAQTAPVATPAVAPIVAPERAAIVAGPGVLPTNTQVLVTLNEELSSKKIKEGHRFTLTVSQDVMLGDYIVIPRGTVAHGEVTWRTGKGVFGKSAKMEFEIRYLDLNGRQVPLVGQFRQEGKGNTGATVGVVLAAGAIGGLFVTGKSAVVEQGREFRVFTREALPVTLGGETTAATTSTGVSN